MPNLQLWNLLEELPIKTKSARIKKLNRNDRFAWAQREFVREVERQYNEGLPVRILVLKGRQLGLSTVTEAILFLWAFLHPGAASLVLSKEDEDSKYLFAMMKRYWNDGPFAGLFPTKYNREGYIEWDGFGSSITTDTAKKTDVGRGKTLLAVHGSEVAFWQEADDIAPSLGEAVPYEHGSIVVYESTANGVGGFFHDEWVKATDPSGSRSVFVPMFFPWWEHDEYSIPETSLSIRDLDDEERELLSAYPQLNLPKLAWRRRKMQNYLNPEMFKQEYPNSPEEAFLSTGSNVFALNKLQQIYKPVEIEDRLQGFLFNDNGKLAFMEHDGGHLFVYRPPDPRKQRRYVVACDPTWTVDGDPAAIQVVDRANLEQVAVWHGSADPKTVGETALALAYWYGAATILNTEIQGGGRKVMEIWREANYPFIWQDRRPDRARPVTTNLGWNSTYETKKWMLGTMQALVNRVQPVIHHPATYYEMSRFVTNEDGTYGPSRRSGHDDTVIALGIAWMTVVTEQPSMDWAAMAGPQPAYVPGETKPPYRVGGGTILGRPVDPSALAGYPSVPAYLLDDDTGVWEHYS